jgi:hypothetical protein
LFEQAPAQQDPASPFASQTAIADANTSQDTAVLLLGLQLLQRSVDGPAVPSGIPEWYISPVNHFCFHHFHDFLTSR